jgi:hypothetical protein
MCRGVLEEGFIKDNGVEKERQTQREEEEKASHRL